MKPAPLFLSFEEALEIQRYQIEHFGGDPGLRDAALLRSALAVPSATFGGQFLHAGIEEMAAAYLFHIAKDHPFVDGNKRTGAMAALVFLELNGYDFTATNDELADAVLKTAGGEESKAELTAFFRKHSSCRAQ